MFQNFALSRSGMALIVCCLAVSGCSINTATYGTGQTAGGALAKDIGSIATFGFIDGSDVKEEINYHQRRPLAVPSKEGFKTPPAPIKGRSTKQVTLAREADIFEQEFLAQQGLLADTSPDFDTAGLTDEERFEREVLAAQQTQETLGQLDNLDQPQEDLEAPEEEFKDPAEEEFKKRSLFRRIVGRSKEKESKALRASNPLAEVPEEYRQVKETPEEVALNDKKKKKKRFLIF